MGLFVNIIMLVIFIPLMYVMFRMLYPIDWKKKTILYGVRVRDEFLKEGPRKYIDVLSSGIRRHALYILVDSMALAVLIMLGSNNALQMILWMVLIIATVFMIYLPYIKGNIELKSLKKTLNIAEEPNIKYTDLKTITASHALNLKALLIPNIISVVLLLFSLLYDVGVLDIGNSSFKGTYATTLLNTVFAFMAFLFVVIAMVMDNIRNEIVSLNSDVNVNYNRAKKRVWNNVWNIISWINLITLLLCMIAIIVDAAEIFEYIIFLVYIVAIGMVVIICAKRDADIKEMYKSEDAIPIEDDDDYWVLGLFYYNKNDKSLNIKKRDSFGSTINLGHPIGACIGILILGVMIYAFGMIAWLGLEVSAPLKISVDNSMVVTSQLKNDYYIKIKDITEVSLIENMDEIKSIKLSGISVSDLSKGEFMVDGEKCKVAFNPEEKTAIKIKADKKTYYISLDTKKDTKEVYEKITKVLEGK